jgi:hypothetical protein
MTEKETVLNRKRVSNWRKNNPEKYRLLQRNSHLKRHYNITLDDYNLMSEAQNHVCAICGMKESSNRGHTLNALSLAVDHCHESGKIRGLLCMDCNQMLGKFNDDPARFEKAAEYLVTHGKVVA